MHAAFAASACRAYTLPLLLDRLQSGQYQIMDTGALTSASLLTHNIEAATGPISAFDVSSSYANAVFGDFSGCFHVYSNRDGPMPSFNPMSQETQFADVVSIVLGVGDGSVVENESRDTEVLRGCGSESH